jgi:hypothetical protein
MLTITKNCCFGYTFILFDCVFNINGFYLSDIKDFTKSPGTNSSGYS